MIAGGSGLNDRAGPTMLIRSWPDIAARDRHASNAARLGRHHISIRNADGRIAHSVAGRAGFRQRIIDRYDRRPSVGNVEPARGITLELALTRDVRPVPEAELGFHFHRSHKPRLSDGTTSAGFPKRGSAGARRRGSSGAAPERMAGPLPTPMPAPLARASAAASATEPTSNAANIEQLTNRIARYSEHS